LEKLRAGTSQNRQEDQTESDDPIQASTFGRGVRDYRQLPMRAGMGDWYYLNR
jgi:hypothetical protein